MATFLLFLVAAVAMKATLFSSVVGASVVESTCSVISRGDPNIQYSFCVKSLYTNPKSSSADMKGLAIIATNMAENKATLAKQKVDSLLKGGLSPAIGECLKTCSDSYTSTISSLLKSVPAIQQSRYSDADTYLSACHGPIDCEGAFAEKNLKSLLSQEDAYCQQLIYISLAIATKLG